MTYHYRYLNDVARIRAKLPRRDTYFRHIAALTEYLCFADWAALEASMLNALEHGPGPPVEPMSIITAPYEEET